MGGAKQKAFTLLEVIVALAIVAIAFAVTIPVIAKARSRSQEIFCQANLRTLSTGLMQYLIDYDDRYPFGFIFNRMNMITGRPASGADVSYITWYSSIDRYLTSGTNEIIPLDANSGFIDGATTRNFHAAFKCPSVGSNYQQKVHYYQHGVVMPQMTLEIPASFRANSPSGGKMPVVWPAKVNQVYPNTALIWDSPVSSDATSFSPSMFWGSDHTISGAAPFVSMIDDNASSMSSENGLLCHPELPERRFRSPGADRFAMSVNALKNPAGPMAMVSDQFLRSLGGPPTANMDFGPGAVWNPGNARFRHTGLGCNVLFADGSVRTLYLRPFRKVAFGSPGTGAANYIDSDFRRNMLMIKWPPGIVDTFTYPTN